MLHLLNKLHLKRQVCATSGVSPHSDTPNVRHVQHPASHRHRQTSGNNSSGLCHTQFHLTNIYAISQAMMHLYS
jgi:hypothetical protein